MQAIQRFSLRCASISRENLKSPVKRKFAASRSNMRRNVLWLFAICASREVGVAQEQYRGEIVNGPKAPLNISAPEGGVLDNESGVDQEMPCVLYPKGSSWSNAKTVMKTK